MACVCYYNPSLSAYTPAEQAIAAGGTVGFNINSILTGVAIQHAAGTPTVAINKAGVYFVALDLDIEPGATGAVTVQLNNNGVAVPDAVTTFAGAADTINHIHLDALIRVLPSCRAIQNAANLTVTVSAAATVTNAKIIVF